MKNKNLLLSILAITLVFGMSVLGCNIDPPDENKNNNDNPIAVTFNNVSANGSGTITTTQLTLTFSKTITGLTTDDITLNGVSSVIKGTVNSSGATYTLPISGFTAGGTLNVAVAKTGYTISGSPKPVTIYYNGFVAVTGITGVPSGALVGTPITLTGTVAPDNATNKTIEWSVKSAGTTGASISGNTLSTTASGTVTVTATIANGKTASTPYTQDFSITITGGDSGGTYGDFTYTVTGNAVSITKYNGAGGSVIIPAQINGKPVTSIGKDAFSDCINLTSVTIPNSVINIGFNPFFGCTSLTEINIDAGNSAFTAENGVLYNKDKTFLHTYPAGKAGAFTIPDSVTSVRTPLLISTLWYSLLL